MDKVEDKASKPTESTPFHDELNAQGDQATVIQVAGKSDRLPAAGQLSRPGASEADNIKELFFGPPDYPSDGFKKGPIPAYEPTFKPYDGQAKQVDKKDETARTADESEGHDEPSEEQMLAGEELSTFTGATLKPEHKILQDLKETTTDFLAEENPAAALPEYEDRFKADIKRTDDHWFATEERQKPIIADAELKYQLDITNVTASSQKLDEQIAELPPDLREKGQVIKNTFEYLGETSSAMKQLQTEFKDHPQFVAAATAYLEDGNAFDTSKSALEAARQPLEDAARAQAISRYVYQKAAEMAGDDKLTGEMADEAFLFADRALAIASKPKPEPGRSFDI
jgi:hypothetical protein